MAKNIEKENSPDMATTSFSTIIRAFWVQIIVLRLIFNGFELRTQGPGEK
jgi:hypothetical protein